MTIVIHLSKEIGLYKEYQMKNLLAAALLLSCSTVYADIYTDNTHCNVDVHGGIKLSPTAITVFQDKQELYQITANNQLIIRGKPQSLSSQQQKLVTNYATQIRQIVPEVKSLASDGIDLAIDGVNVAFGELLGQNSDTAQNITEQLTTIKQKIVEKFDDSQTLYFDQNGMKDDDLLGKDFERKIEKTVEDAVQKSMGSMLMAVGKQLITSGGDMDSFEAKMDKLGDQIDQQIESKSKILEQRGEHLCHAMVNIDQLEEQLKGNIAGFPRFDVLTVNIEHHKNS